MSKLFQAKVRIRGQDRDFVPVTWGGVRYFGDEDHIKQLISVMSQHFPHREYIIEEDRI